MNCMNYILSSLNEIEITNKFVQTSKETTKHFLLQVTFCVTYRSQNEAPFCGTAVMNQKAKSITNN